MSFWNAVRSITLDKLAPITIDKSPSSTTFSTTSATYVDVTNLSRSLTLALDGRPVKLWLEGFVGVGAYVGGQIAGSPYQFTLAFCRTTVGVPGTIIIQENLYSLNADNTLNRLFVPPGVFTCEELTPAGDHTFKVQVRVVSGNVDVQNCRLCVKVS